MEFKSLHECVVRPETGHLQYNEDKNENHSLGMRSLASLH